MPELGILCCFSFFAGLVDSVVGGGGLIQLPVLMIFLPSVPITTLLGTNKLASFVGTSVASVQYARRVPFIWRMVLTTAAAAFFASMLGARAVSLIEPDGLRPVIIILLITIAVYLSVNKNLGLVHAPRLSGWRQIGAGVLAGATIGFYDGFFGPGTGSFLIFVFVGIFGLGFVQASGSAKVVNVATNMAALIYFAYSGHILYATALPMAFFNVLGAITGSRLAILKGNRFVRVFFLAVVAALIVKLSYDTFTPFFA